MSKEPNDVSLRCSFCHLSQDNVGKLIASASSRFNPKRAYICDQCITICAAILEDDRVERSESTPPPPQIENPRLLHPLAPKLLAAVETWIRGEDLGTAAAEEDLMEVRHLARILFGLAEPE